MDKIYEIVSVKIPKLTEIFLGFSNNNTCDKICLSMVLIVVAVQKIVISCFNVNAASTNGSAVS